MAYTTEPRPNQRPAESSLPFKVPHKRSVICCLLLALATIAIYNSVTRAPFLNYDDSINVTDNPQVRAGLTWNTVVWAFHTPEALDWHPISWLSYALDCQIFGLNPSGFHTVNVLLHAANAVLLFLILQSATGFFWRSLVVASLFALHPINVESVAWISERKNVLSMFFFLLALAAYGWYVRRPGVGRYLAVTVAYAFALMSKAQVITFPFALLLLDYWPLCRFGRRNGASFWKLMAEKVPWLALSAASAVLTMKGGMAFNYTVETATFPLWIRLGNAAISYVKYLEKAFWPLNLALVYPHPGFGIGKSAIALSALAILLLTALAVIFRHNKPFFVGWFWFLGTLVPMIGLVPIGPHAMADRYAYIPLLGIFVIVAWGAADFVKPPSVALPLCPSLAFVSRWRISPAMGAAGAVFILLMLGIALYRQVSFWKNNVTLWTHTLRITGRNFTAEESLALALIDEGRIQEAFPHLQRASLLQPDDPLAALNLATYHQMRGNYPAALEGFAKVVHFAKAAPSLRATAEANSGYAHLSLKQYGTARQDFEAALHDQPANSAAFRGLGLVAQRAGDIIQATKDYQRSVDLQPSPVGYLLLAQALAVGRQEQAARAAEAQAARMTQDLNDDVAVVRQLLSN